MSGKNYLDLMQFFEGYVRNYRRLNLTGDHNRSMMTNREIDYFANLGEMLGFDSFVEDSKFDKIKNRSRPMDLAWWRWDSLGDMEHYDHLALHLERENSFNKDLDTIDKLFSETENEYIPHNVIGIQTLNSNEKIEELNKVVKGRNSCQQSKVLMVYRYPDVEKELERVSAYLFTPRKADVAKHAVCKRDDFGYWFMCFEKEYKFYEAKTAKKEVQLL
ncbi:hypothetical protein [Bacillus sp. B-jedd]|uniref:hypothetical protein n=1 Tax=Bacillus sp. B-jedd TaxID=1476857 RepID=UPI00051569FD|nr:hypothetical protein [Bacillus sp. B-jedd]CEG26368.1 hypothetical protein BN1002_01213 [Bacillus sp. B-jedd]